MNLKNLLLSLLNIMNPLNAIKITINSSLRSSQTVYPLEVSLSSTVFQVKQEIEKLEKVSADWILLLHPIRFHELNDNALIKDKSN